MEEALKEKVDLMVGNYHELKKGFKWEANLVKHFGAMTHAVRNKEVDIERLEEIRKYIKSQTSWTSYFRGVNEFVLSNLLCFEEDYKTFFRDINLVYEKMRSTGFKNSSYLPLAAYTITKQVEMDDWNYRIDRMNAFYKKMKENHFWLTSSDDYVYAAVLGTTDLDVEETSIKIEECYRTLNREGIYKGNDLQTLSHILALGEDSVEIKCFNSMNLYRKLKENKCGLQYSGLASLGLLALLTTDADKMAGEVKEVYDYIYNKDGYGFWSLSTAERALLAATLVSDYYVDGIQKGIMQIALGNSINAIIIAQEQAAVAAACAACSATAASAANS